MPKQKKDFEEKKDREAHTKKKFAVDRYFRH